VSEPANYQELPGLQVEVERLVYMPHLDAPPERPHPFVYFIGIENRSEKAVLIRGRKWILKDEKGEMFVVEGSGVVGQTPKILPGERFNYSSYHVIARNSEVSGAFFGIDEAGTPVRVKIPRFFLKIPDEE
jgi:ApaG protein